jgi:hypothetical protein
MWGGWAGVFAEGSQREIMKTLMMEKACELCGKPNADVAYFRTGMTTVVYRHAACDRRRELSPSEERQEWGWLMQARLSLDHPDHEARPGAAPGTRGANPRIRRPP